MRPEKIERALICYAGSAPEASIGSKPIGSELARYIGLDPLTSQEISPVLCHAAALRKLFFCLQTFVFIELFCMPNFSATLK